MLKIFSLLFILFFNFVFAHQNIEKVLMAIKDVPEWNEAEVLIKPLKGGLTNENFIVSINGSKYFVRCSCSDNHLLGASLEREWKCASLAADLNLTPKTVLYRDDLGILITDFVEDKGINPRDPDTMNAYCEMIRSLHNAPLIFPTEFCPFACIQSYLDNAQKVDAPLPLSIFEKVLPAIQNMKRESALKKPCHIDLHKGNILNDGEHLCLIDWEYASMSDPFFDLATLASVEYFTDPEMDLLLTAYLQRSPTPQETEHFINTRVLADARWALWSYLQAKISSIDGNFTELGDTFLNQCLERIE